MPERKWFSRYRMFSFNLHRQAVVVNRFSCKDAPDPFNAGAVLIEQVDYLWFDPDFMRAVRFPHSQRY